MINRILTCLLLLLSARFLAAQENSLEAGMRINRSMQIRKTEYRIHAPADSSHPVLLIEGNDLVIDFNNAALVGSSAPGKPDEFSGTAILVRNSRNVIIRNLSARGYKIALVARNVDRLRIENCDFSYNYRPHLNSSQEKEDISDWMSYHHNEKDEWLRYGAAMYLRDCSGAIVRNCRVTGGQNALMMMRCDDGLIMNNDFSFNSGIGIGMYRCNRNRVIYNRVIFNVRGYSHGVYNRGQDSAGILVYEQSNENLFYMNSVTHGGDGFFLWAGQTTMDSGQGGCNDNIIYRNDFSYAPTNGIEATFSSNRFSGNIVEECDYGIWAGYSYRSIFRNNQIRNNRVGIAIEHGQENMIGMNVFENNREGIKLWANKIEPSDWGYPKKRDTRSWQYQVTNNVFVNNGKAFDFSSTDSLWLAENYMDTEEISGLMKDTTIRHWGPVYNNSKNARPDLEEESMDFRGNMIKAGKPVEIPDTSYTGRKNIMITEWGPYDFRSPLIWNSNPTDTTGSLRFDLLGPKGKWKIISFKGVENISASSGEFPASITAIKTRGAVTDIRIELEYTGEAITTPFGEMIIAGNPFPFHFRKFFQPMDWQVSFYSLDTSRHDPIKTGSLFSPLEKKAPFLSTKVKSLDYAWWGGIREAGTVYQQFITRAEAGADFEQGEYEFSVTWDDAVRIYLDEKLLINEWNPSLYDFDESPHRKVRVRLDGNHTIRVEHIELGGFACLSLKIKPVE